ncbi:hypothetical protein BGZ94_009869 [Podila epigama]|nr:hypothetical protein BGZ94_009869 [Podila epigama]
MSHRSPQEGSVFPSHRRPHEVVLDIQDSEQHNVNHSDAPLSAKFPQESNTKHMHEIEETQEQESVDQTELHVSGSESPAHFRESEFEAPQPLDPGRRRWYLKELAKSTYGGTEEYGHSILPPIYVTKSTKVTLPSVELGFYTIIFCFSVKDSDLELLKPLYVSWDINYKRVRVAVTKEDFAKAAAKFMMHSARGERFLWLKGSLATVWDLESGSMVSYILFQTRARPMEVLWSDETRIVVKENSNITAFSTESGLCLGTVSQVESPCSTDEHADGNARYLLRIHHAKIDSELEPYIISNVDYLPPIFAELDSLFGKSWRTSQGHTPHQTPHASTIVTSRHGSKLDVQFMEDIILKSDGSKQSICGPACRQEQRDTKGLTGRVNVEAVYFKLVVASRFTGWDLSVTVDMISTDGQARNLLSLVLEVYDRVFFLQKQSQLVVHSNRRISIWSLPEHPDDQCELLLEWAAFPGYSDDVDVQHENRISLSTCMHERHLTLKINDERIPITVSRVFCKERVDYFLAGLHTAGLNLLLYPGERPTVEWSNSPIIRYIWRHINSYPNPGDDSESVMSSLCKMAYDHVRYKNYKYYLDFMRTVLYSPGAHWVPRIRYTNGANPLGIVLAIARTQPEAMELAEIIISWCFAQSKIENRPRLEYLLFTLECMPELVSSHPEMALKLSRWFAYFHVPDRQFVIDHHAIIHPPALRMFRSSYRCRLYECKSPILQFRYGSGKPDKRNEYFTEDVFVAPISLLWTVVMPAGERDSDFIMINALSKSYVEMNDEVWVTIREKDSMSGDDEYWKQEQDIFNHSQTKWSRYFRSPYNYLDLLAFFIPMASSVNQLANILQENSSGTTWDLSFSVVVIFLHMLSELRVKQQVCKYVTIIIRIIVEIKVFFIIFALGILFFSLAIQHILRGCASKGCANSPTSFPENFFGAITAVYFIMGGRYDPITTELGQEAAWQLHVMIMIYFLFTVVVMLNVLIALINLGFNKADETWRVVWLENRLRYAESAENMSYSIPGFRQTHIWFPKEIYYTATKTRVKAYWERIKDEDKQLGRAMAVTSTPPEDGCRSKNIWQLSKKDTFSQELSNEGMEFLRFEREESKNLFRDLLKGSSDDSMDKSKIEPIHQANRTVQKQDNANGMLSHYSEISPPPDEKLDGTLATLDGAGEGDGVQERNDRTKEMPFQQERRNIQLKFDQILEQQKQMQQMLELLLKKVKID